jgi:hypothetical protein
MLCSRKATLAGSDRVRSASFEILSEAVSTASLELTFDSRRRAGVTARSGDCAPLCAYRHTTQHNTTRYQLDKRETTERRT